MIRSAVPARDVRSRRSARRRARKSGGFTCITGTCQWSSAFGLRAHQACAAIDTKHALLASGGGVLRLATAICRQTLVDDSAAARAMSERRVRLLVIQVRAGGRTFGQVGSFVHGSRLAQLASASRRPSSTPAQNRARSPARPGDGAFSVCVEVTRRARPLARRHSARTGWSVASMDRFHIVDLLFGVGAEHTSGREESPCGAALRG